MKKRLILLFFFLTACTPTPAPVDVDATPQLIAIYIAPSTETWIPLIYTCANHAQIELVSRTPDIASADISLQIGETDKLAYQIGEVTLVVAGNTANPVEKLSQIETAEIYTGRIRNWAALGGEDAEINLWVYGQDDDLQHAFNEIILESNILSSTARQAQIQAVMREEIAKDTYALGIITQAQADENLRVLYSLGSFPVLAIPREEPQGKIFSLLSCLQGKQEIAILGEY